VERVSTVLGGYHWWQHMAGARFSTWVWNSANTFFAEVERAAENLAKSGKPFGGFPPAPTPSGAGRRESMPVMGGPRPYHEQQPQQPQQQQQQQQQQQPPPPPQQQGTPAQHR